MPRYFFHVKDNDGIIEDREGIELPRSNSVQRECRRFLTEVLSEEEWDSELVSAGEFYVTNAHGKTLFVAPSARRTPVWKSGAEARVS